MQFVVVTRDYAGLGLATRLQDEGHSVTLATNPPDNAPDAWVRVGNGLVAKEGLPSVLERRSALRDAYWIWDMNHSVEACELLREENFKVLGGGNHAYTMEHDRHACVEFASVYGLLSPPSHRFDNLRDAIHFLAANRGTAYVYKPDEGANHETFLPESEDPAEANLDLRAHLESSDESGSFILQERKDGVETNVEVWFQSGEPVFAFMALESKKRYTGDMGELAGCAFDFVWTIPLECRAVTESVGRSIPHTAV
jgi:hypothetical protein